jgi:hypothetical protein
MQSFPPATSNFFGMRNRHLGWTVNFQTKLDTDCPLKYSVDVAIYMVQQNGSDVTGLLPDFHSF